MAQDILRRIERLIPRTVPLYTPQGDQFASQNIDTSQRYNLNVGDQQYELKAPANVGEYESPDTNAISQQKAYQQVGSNGQLQSVSQAQSRAFLAYQPNFNRMTGFDFASNYYLASTDNVTGQYGDFFKNIDQNQQAMLQAIQNRTPGEYLLNNGVKITIDQNGELSMAVTSQTNDIQTGNASAGFNSTFPADTVAAGTRSITGITQSNVISATDPTNTAQLTRLTPQETDALEMQDQLEQAARKNDMTTQSTQRRNDVTGVDITNNLDASQRLQATQEPSKPTELNNIATNDALKRIDTTSQPDPARLDPNRAEPKIQTDSEAQRLAKLQANAFNAALAENIIRTQAQTGRVLVQPPPRDTQAGQPNPIAANANPNNTFQSNPNPAQRMGDATQKGGSGNAGLMYSMANRQRRRQREANAIFKT